MSLRRFLDTAYYLLIEEYQRIGIPLMDALEKMAMYQDSGQVTEQTLTAASSPPVASANDQALAVLQAQMSGVQGKPKTG